MAYVSCALWFDDWNQAVWDISPDGRRFLMMKETGIAATGVVRSRKITVVLNWFEELKRLVPAEKKYGRRHLAGPRSRMPGRGWRG